MTAVAAASNNALAAAGLADGTLKVYDLTTADAAKAERASFKSTGSPVTAVAFLPDPATLLAGSADKVVSLWALPSTGGPKNLAGHTAQIYNVVWSPDGKLVATAAADKTVRLWDVAKGAQVRQINAHEKVAYAVAFHPKGDLLATGGDDKLIKYWNVADGKELRKSQGHGAPIYSLSFSPDGTKLASGSVDKTIRIWNVADGKELQQARRPSRRRLRRGVQSRRQETGLGRLRRQPLRVGRGDREGVISSAYRASTR